MTIGQKDKRVIQEICAFFDREGITSSMRLDKNTGVYYAIVQRVDHIAGIIEKTESFIKTENKLREIAAFKENLARPRKTLQQNIIQAREILGLGRRSEG